VTGDATPDAIVHEGTAPTRPIRLITAYDLKRSRLMTFFRVLLAIPHVFWFTLWSLVALLVALVNWVATLFAGRSPTSLHEFLAAYLRYSVHLNAFVFMGANQFPGFSGAPGSYPIDLHVDPPARQRRLVTFFRLFLSLPAILLAGALASAGFSVSSGGGFFLLFGVLAVAAVLGWWAALFTGRMPAGLEHAVAYSVGYQAQTSGYMLLLTDRYPDAGPALVAAPVAPAAHPIELRVTDDLRRSRLTVFFRLLLALPHFVWLMLWGLVVLLTGLLGWFAAVFMGRLPARFHRFIAAYVRYSVQVNSFLTLVANPFPGFVPSDERPYPVDLQVGAPERQSRLKIFFRFPLVLPAAVMAGAYSGALGVAVILGWFAALFTGRMPRQLRDLGAVVQRYSAQYYAYAFLLTDRYPYMGPAL
jgi:Domain of unknown function (DUF4389)